MAKHISTEVCKDLQRVVSEWYKTLPPATSVEEAEEVAEEARRIVGERVFELGLLDTTGKASYRGRTLPCSCGATKVFVGYRTRFVKSLVGEKQISRAYYHCEASQHPQGRKQDAPPWDQEQGLTGKVGTARFQGAVSHVMGLVPYSEGVELIAKLCDVTIEESTAEAVVLEVGARIRAVEKKRVEAVKLRLERATAERLLVDRALCAPLPPLEMRQVVGKRLYFGVDAATAHIDGAWHNVQNGIVFNVKQDAQGHDTLWERAYTAARMDMETLGWRMRALSEVWQGSAYEERVFLGDGAPCNWNLASTYFPEAIPILDFWHVSDHVWAVSRLLYRQDDAKAKGLGEKWVAERLHSLKHEGPKSLLRALKRRRGKTPSQQEGLRREINYFTSNQDRMDYPAHVAAGRMIGSGPIEAACKSVVGGRLKGTGMRWSDAGADAILAVRTTILNGEAGQLAKLARAA